MLRELSFPAATILEESEGLPQVLLSDLLTAPQEYEQIWAGYSLFGCRFRAGSIRRGLDSSKFSLRRRRLIASRMKLARCRSGSRDRAFHISSVILTGGRVLV
jgi:hypothetical protein